MIQIPRNVTFIGETNQEKKAIIFYLLLCLSWIIITFLLLYHFGKDDSFLIINGYHNQVLDYVCGIGTNLGDGIISIVLIIACFISKRNKLAWTLVTVFILSNICIQVAKHIYDEPRPSAHFEGIAKIKSIPWVSLSRHYSFPSGHTCSAFSQATVLALWIKNTKASWWLFFYSCFVGYSRIYVAQHFLYDVFWGSLFGIYFGLVSCFAFTYIKKRKSKI